MSEIRWQDLNDTEREVLAVAYDLIMAEGKWFVPERFYPGVTGTDATKRLAFYKLADKGYFQRHEDGTLSFTPAGRALVESAASDEATDAQMQADAKAVREFVEHQHQQRETIRQQAAEIERLKASNAELRASADEAQTARLKAVKETAMRHKIALTQDEDETLRHENAALLERLAKLEAALDSIKDMHVVSMSMAGLEEKAYRMTIERMRVTAADALKGDGDE